jgi:tetratricopeptide (TPR) repeat protein
MAGLVPSNIEMRVPVILILAAGALLGADEQRLALALKAQSEFDHVQMAVAPDLRETTACIQTQAALLAVSTPEEVALIRYRKAFCMLAGATVTHNGADFNDAAAEFDKAAEAWPARGQVLAGKGAPPEPVSSSLPVLSAIARLQAGADDAALERAWKEISAATERPVCSPTLMPTALCNAVVKTGREWLGWMALRQGGLAEATKKFSDAVGTGWPEWVAGRKAFRDGQYREAVTQYRQAVDLARKGPPASMMDRLGPHPDVPGELVELGGAQLLAGDGTAAVATLDEAVKADPANARALYLRARAKEIAGQNDAALADYNLASRTAFANAKDLASGEAHLYRGILLFRRKDYTHAEDEFSSALNFDISGAMRADAVAWRHLAAVAMGSCDASRQYLERSIAAASPYFPRTEARNLINACGTKISSGGVVLPAN